MCSVEKQIYSIGEEQKHIAGSGSTDCQDLVDLYRPGSPIGVLVLTRRNVQPRILYE